MDVRSGIVRNLLLVVLAWASWFPLAEAAEGVREKLTRQQRTNGRETLRAIADLETIVERGTVTILNGDEVVALGTALPQFRVVVTKASELGWQTMLEFPRGQRVAPETAFVDEANDLAVLRVDYDFSDQIETKEIGEAQRGTILIAPSNKDQRIKMGIISAQRRTIERIGGALGVLLGQQGVTLGGVEVSEVYEETAAARAGLQEGDIIRSVNGKVVLLREQVQEEIAAHHPGENVTLQLRRGDDTVDLDVILGFRSTYFGQLDRNQRLSGETSTRLTGFEEILQHDIPVDVNAMGGPVLDLQGRLVGVNIARADRVSTYALPIGLVESIVAESSD